MFTKTFAEMLRGATALSSLVASSCTPGYAEERTQPVLPGNLDHIQKPGFRW